MRQSQDHGSLPLTADRDHKHGGRSWFLELGRCVQFLAVRFIDRGPGYEMDFWVYEGLAI